MSVFIVEGNLLNSNAQYIIHQTNCVSFGFSGLANSIFEKYPECNVYQIRSEFNTWHKPGHVYIVEKVINAMGQFFLGRHIAKLSLIKRPLPLGRG